MRFSQSLFINTRDHERSKVNYFFKCLNRQIKYQTNFGWNRSEEPNIKNRSSKLNMSHAVAANNRIGHLYSTLITNNSFITDFLIFTTITFPIFGRSKNFLSKQTAFFRLLRTVVNGFRLTYLTE